ncbi:hypothetical protein MTO96_006528 [Rhipicephalus appendiculatus]
MVVEASHSSNPAKRKAVSSMPETVQAKAKSEIREMLNSICFEIQKINERLSAVDQRLLVMDQKIDAQNVKIACVENRVQGTESKVQEMDIRTSTSTRDSVPDLVFVKNAGSAVSSNLLVDLGSDHYIVATNLQVEQKRKKAFSVPDWDKFREVRKARASSGEKPESLVQWSEAKLQREDACASVGGAATFYYVTATCPAVEAGLV